MLASDLITRARILLHDETPVRWSDVELLLWLSDALRDLATFVPESYVITSKVALAANASRQSLPATATRLFDVTRNMGASGSTPGSVIRLVDRKILDQIDPDWPQTMGTTVEHYLYDFKNPLSYMVYPRPTAATFVELVHGAMPPEVTALNTTIPLSDMYVSAVLDGVVFRAMSKDAEFGNAQLAAAYKQMFDARVAQIVTVTAQRTPADASGGSQA